MRSWASALVVCCVAAVAGVGAETLRPSHALVWASEAYGAPATKGVEPAPNTTGRVAYHAVHTGQLAASLANLMHSGASDSGGAHLVLQGTDARSPQSVTRADARSCVELAACPFPGADDGEEVLFAGHGCCSGIGATAGMCRAASGGLSGVEVDGAQ
jgi:hypothetical protein